MVYTVDPVRREYDFTPAQVVKTILTNPSCNEIREDKLNTRAKCELKQFEPNVISDETGVDFSRVDPLYDQIKRIPIFQIKIFH